MRARFGDQALTTERTRQIRESADRHRLMREQAARQTHSASISAQPDSAFAPAPATRSNAREAKRRGGLFACCAARASDEPSPPLVQAQHVSSLSVPDTEEARKPF
eukprot:SAG11_NODE_12_length_27025_cov_37.402681_8_plen_106_part_00